MTTTSLALRMLSTQSALINSAILKSLNSRVKSGLPKLLGFQVQRASIEDKTINAAMELKEHHLAANGYCHAGSVVALADTACGAGTFMTLPKNAKNFTTIELKSNFVDTAIEGTLTCDAAQVHGGKSTQVWDATVFAPNGKAIAHFRCTQMLLY